MTLTTSPAVRCAGILIALVCTACTGGQVTKNGLPVVGSTVEIRTCTSDLGTYVTSTDASGVFEFNPYDPNSPMIDSDEYIAEGPIAIIVAGADGSSVSRRDHQYNQTCNIAYNGSQQNLPCRLHGIDLVPMNILEYATENLAFYEQDCGLAFAPAKRLSEESMSFVAESTEPSTELSQASCLTQCADSCSSGGLLNPDMLKGKFSPGFESCMCSCAESSCEASFEPFCSERAAELN